MKKEAKVHMLPTENVSCIAFHKLKDEEPGLFYSDKPSVEEAFDNQHLYIISDEVVKKGDYYIHKELGSKLDSVKQLLEDGEFLAKKIIATTDKYLTLNTANKDRRRLDAVPQIPQSFIEEYCKAGGIDKVLIPFRWGNPEKTIKHYTKDTNNCIIIHPVEEKMYSRDTFDKILKECYQGGVDGVSWEEIAKRIKENL